MAGVSSADRERITRIRVAGRVRDALASGHVLVTAGAGCGKTTAIQQAGGLLMWPVAWVGCSDPEQTPGMLLLGIVSAIAAAAPGASDTIAEGVRGAT
jgi:ATP/maltotriose-dependent transcriptional regulator MalT